jgi:hypothetical protein
LIKIYHKHLAQNINVLFVVEPKETNNLSIQINFMSDLKLRARQEQIILFHNVT